MLNVYLAVVFSVRWLAALIAGLFGRQIGRAGAHWVTILGVGASCALSFYVLLPAAGRRARREYQRLHLAGDRRRADGESASWSIG